MRQLTTVLSGYIRNDRIGSQRLAVVAENNELVLRPARQQSLIVLAPGQTLAVSPYASGPAQPPPTPAATDAFAFAERVFERNGHFFERTLSVMSDKRSVMRARGANTSTRSTLRRTVSPPLASTLSPLPPNRSNEFQREEMAISDQHDALLYTQHMCPPSHPFC